MPGGVLRALIGLDLLSLVCAHAVHTADSVVDLTLRRVNLVVERGRLVLATRTRSLRGERFEPTASSVAKLGTRISPSFACSRPQERRPTTSTRSTAAFSRHSRSTPSPTSVMLGARKPSSHVLTVALAEILMTSGAMAIVPSPASLDPVPARPTVPPDAQVASVAITW